ncbi:hypothetical protein EJD97_001902 [Solanum chilense]|uniref:Uncharacterized protein n=1 Tax=Solanum chilense TaxID=4083 RepID=A0A6N2ANQ9_SOLCI|nr:hypothetical protein EJD97_001902 [Solanum chilense]
MVNIEEKDEYGALNSEDDYDCDVHTFGEQDDAKVESTAHLFKAFGSTLHIEIQDEIQNFTAHQVLSHREVFAENTQINLSMIAILKPFVENTQINKYKTQVNTDKVFFNKNGKFRVFYLFQVRRPSQEATLG